MFLRKRLKSYYTGQTEGSGRNSTKDFIRFLNITSGSLSEVETQIEIAKRLEYISDTENIKKTITSLQKMLYKLKKSLNNKLKQQKCDSGVVR